MPFEVDKARISVVSAGQDEEVVVHPTDHPKVGELEHFVHDPHHLHINSICSSWPVEGDGRLEDYEDVYENNKEDDDAEACQVDIVNLVAKADS